MIFVDYSVLKLFSSLICINGGKCDQNQYIVPKLAYSSKAFITLKKLAMATGTGFPTSPRLLPDLVPDLDERETNSEASRSLAKEETESQQEAGKWHRRWLGDGCDSQLRCTRDSPKEKLGI